MMFIFFFQSAIIINNCCAFTYYLNYIIIHKYTKKMVTIARTPSDYRAYKNICKMLDNAMVA